MFSESYNKILQKILVWYIPDLHEVICTVPQLAVEIEKALFEKLEIEE